MSQEGFFERLQMAEDAGLNKDEALGDMDMDLESSAIFADPTMIVNDCGCDFDPGCPRCFPF